MSKILINLPQQQYILRNVFHLGLKDTPCICDECGAAIKNVCVVQGMADRLYYNLGTTCVEKHSKEDENFLTSASQYKLKMAKKANSKIDSFIKLYKDLEKDSNVTNIFLSIYPEQKRTNKGIVEHAIVTIMWLYDPESQIDRSNENWYLNAGNYAWSSSRHTKGDPSLDLAFVDVEKNSELKAIFENAAWEYPVKDDFSNEAVLQAYKDGWKDPNFKNTDYGWYNNHFAWYLDIYYPTWEEKRAAIENEIAALKKEHNITW